MGITAAFGKQYRKPTRLFGRLIGLQMNRHHGELADWGIEWLDLRPDDRILDLGCGAGEALRHMARAVPQGIVAGVDYSDLMIRMARKANRTGIEKGLVDLRSGSISELPFEDGSFTVATSIESFYYLSDPVSDLRGVSRVLRPGGQFLLVLEWCKDMPNIARIAPLAKKMNCPLYSGEELVRILEEAGYTDCGFDFKGGVNWLRVRGRKPGVPSR